jgi:hypothetical protein
MQEEMENVQDVDGVEVLRDQAALSIIVKAEIDSQILTAQKFPRSIKKVLDKILSIATINEDVAQSCTFALPRGKNKDGTEKILTGPSVRLAEIVFSSYGNIRGGARVIHNDGKSITAQGICHDLETNACITIEVKRSILQNVWETRNGKRVKTGKMETMTEDMQIVTGNAACAIAFRNSTFKIFPAALLDNIHDQVKLVAMGTEATLTKRRDTTLKYLAAKQVSEERIFAAIDVNGIEDIDLEKLATLRGMCTLIKNGEGTAAELFPEPKKTPEEKGEGLNRATEDAIKKQAEKATGKKSEKVEPK